METTGKEKRRRLHSTDRRESPHETNILQTVVTPGGTFAGTEVLGSTPGKRMIHDYLAVCNSRLRMIRDYLTVCNSRWKKTFVGDDKSLLEQQRKKLPRSSRVTSELNGMLARRPKKQRQVASLYPLLSMPAPSLPVPRLVEAAFFLAVTTEARTDDLPRKLFAKGASRRKVCERARKSEC